MFVVLDFHVDSQLLFACRFGSGYGGRCAAWDQFEADTFWPSYGPYELTADSPILATAPGLILLGAVNIL